MRYFKRAWYNKLRDLARDSKRIKRTGILVDLEGMLKPPSTPSILPEDDLDYLMDHLSPTTFQYISQVIEPGKEVFDFAWKEFCRRNKLANQGKKVSGIKKFKITQRHVRKVLGLNKSQSEQALEEVRRYYQLQKQLKGVSKYGR